MRLTLLALLLGFAVPAFGAERDWTQIGKGLSAESVNLIELGELWHSAQGGTYRSSDGLVVGFWPIDPESARREDGWVVIGFAIFGLGDVAEKPVAVRLWSLRPLVFSASDSVDFERRHKRVSLFFRSPDCIDGDDRCSAELVAVVPKLSGGAEVFINNRSFGAIR